jgi:alpha-L-rhamnosidase
MILTIFLLKKMKDNKLKMCKFVLIAFLCGVSIMALASNTNTAQWIWQQEDGPANTWVAFRKTINIDEVPTEAITKISVDTKYWLWINGEMVLFEGGLARGHAPNTIYYDPVDFAPYLKKGENTIAILVWYWGRTRKVHEDSGKGGLCVVADWSNDLNTDNTWKMKVHPAYDPNSGGGGPSANRVQAYNVKFDARQAMGDWTDEAWYTTNFDDSNWKYTCRKRNGK